MLVWRTPRVLSPSILILRSNIGSKISKLYASSILMGKRDSTKLSFVFFLINKYFRILPDEWRRNEATTNKFLENFYTRALTLPKWQGLLSPIEPR